MKPTLKQIAEASGISISTVSRVATQKGYVSEDVRKKVLQLMDEMGYAPQRERPQVRKNAEDLVMILVGGIRSSLVSGLVESLAQELQKKQKRPFMAVTMFSGELERYYLQFAANNHFFGIIALTITESPETLEMLRNFPCPITMLDHFYPSLEIDCLRPDYYRMGFMGAEYLISHGHRRIGFVGGRVGSTITRDKQTGIEDALRLHKLEVRPEWFYHVERLIWENGPQAAQYFLSLPERPTAIISSNDISVGILNELISQGLHLPEDLSIFTCEDSSPAAHCQIPLTALSIDFGQMAANAVQMLCKRKRSPAAPRNLLMFSPQLVERQSVSYYNSI